MKPNVKPNALFTADNLYVMNGMDSECVDLIYLDPPFNSKRLYKAPVGSKAAGAAFEDMWTWADVDSALMVRLSETHPFLVDYITSIEVIHSKGMMAYIAYMAQRLLEMRRVLKPTGSIYLHCDPTASHYLKVVMDRIFGKENYRNEIVWHYSDGTAPMLDFKRKHDTIFRYSKTKDLLFNRDAVKMPVRNLKRYNKCDESGRAYFEDARRYNPPRRYYADTGIARDDVWTFLDDNSLRQINSMSKERTGYPTQKPLALMNIIIQASSNPGDIVLDPFCGCATTCVAAQQLGRKWIGIDLSDKTVPLIRERLANDVGTLFDDFAHYSSPPSRADVEPMTKKQAKPILYGMQEGHCAGCKDHFEARHLEVDHYIPKSKGGGDYLANFQLLCGNCNRIKGNRPMEYLLMVIESRKAARRVFGKEPVTPKRVRIS